MIKALLGEDGLAGLALVPIIACTVILSILIYNVHTLSAPLEKIVCPCGGSVEQYSIMIEESETFLMLHSNCLGD